ncbi:DNA cross-link repair 1A protein [[Emmonsia] crescens]|uniref:DNA cross-link repair 1A protein n=1 Tax=[Emmonsia] crescens TaxID=73230 RepID=A0A2B7ZBZ9_9EURO|nr:DNA cross-link repair 1A protein [Emmonsia crescens]
MSSSSPYFNADKNGGRQAFKPLQPSSRRNGGKRNTSILNFFKKSETPPKSSQKRITNYIVKSRNNAEKSPSTNYTEGSESLFFTEEGGKGSALGHPIEQATGPARARSVSPFGGFGEAAESFDDGDRYNENYNTGQKRQKVDKSGHIVTTAGVECLAETGLTGAKGSPPSAVTISNINRIGPFLDESDSEEESNCAYNKDSLITRTQTGARNNEYDFIPPTDSSNESHDNSTMKGVTFAAASGYLSSSEDADSCELQDGGSLYGQSRERYDEPQEGFGKTTSIEKIDLDASGLFYDDNIAICPICSKCLTGITDNEVSLHVNNCLDGNPTPVPGEKTSVAVRSKSVISIARLNKAAIPRPGQQNPFTIESKGKETSAFSKIMSGNAEDAAWAAASAKEEASRGKQAYERTCPFYKILPGFSICVDAFRYGAVEGCSAYFLSHFHSDHYIGLTSSWCHGQIYCSIVTGNLVRQQLKVDPKWITDIEFDKTFEIPDTNGAWVTMLPANHCPGSSMFLFEKRVSKGPKPKIHRILHCGDFRACPAHVQHPLLRPDVVDSLTGKVGQQIIDVCYLDTTYLNPKYAFPNQDDVVTACAALCADLDATEHDNSDDATRGPKNPSVKTMMDFRFNAPQLPTRPGDASSKSRGRLLVVIGTYSIGKERLCVAIARALNCKIYAPVAKQRICACLEDDELSKLLTNNPLEAQVHMQTLMEVRAETLPDYLDSLKPHFSRIVGFRPTGWNYRPPAGRMTDSPPVSSVLYSDSWKPRFCTRDLTPQRGSNRESAYYSVPYSEHSSFRELTMFCCALRIAKVIPTVNVGSKKSREKMKLWVEKWEAEKRKNGLFKVDNEAVRW